MSDVLSNIQERGEQNRANIKLSADLQQQLAQQRGLVRQRLLAQNAAVQASTQNARVQSKLAVINANQQAEADRAQQRIQLLQARAQIRAAQGGRQQSTRQTATALRLAGKEVSRPRWIDALNERVGNLPTPGGLFALFIVLLVFVFLIVPVSATGQTRFELFWLTLLGRTKLDPTGGGEPLNEKTGASGGSSNGGEPLKEKTASGSAGPVTEIADVLPTVQVSDLSSLPIPPFGLPGMLSSSGR